MAKLLKTIPGIGYYSALFLVSEIDDINRFPDSYRLCSYAGLVSSTHSSGGVTYHANITKTGSKHIRWLMPERVHAHIRSDKNSNIHLSLKHQIDVMEERLKSDSPELYDGPAAIPRNEYSRLLIITFRALKIIELIDRILINFRCSMEWL